MSICVICEFSSMLNKCTSPPSHPTASTWSWKDRIVGGCLNSLAPGRSECYFKNVIFNLVLLIGLCRSSNGNALRWMPKKFTDDKSTMVQVDWVLCRHVVSLGPNELIHWPLPLGDVNVILYVYFSNSFYKLMSWVLPVKLALGENNRIRLMISQHWFK